MVSEVFPGRGWHPVRVRFPDVPGGGRVLHAQAVTRWCEENLGQKDVEWSLAGNSGYDGVFRVKKQHIAWFMLTWG